MESCVTGRFECKQTKTITWYVVDILTSDAPT